MSDQSHEDADVAQILGLVTSLTTGVAAVADEIAVLKAANPGVNFTGLDGAVTALSGVNDSLQTLVPVVAPPVDPTPSA